MSSTAAATSLSLALALSAVDSPAVIPAAPARLAIYYGYPSLVNGGTDLAGAVELFGRYDVIVLGDGLEFADGRGPGAAEHAFTAALIERLRRPGDRSNRSVLGYVDIGNTQRLDDRQIADRIGRWSDLGATGVLLDEAGFDFGVTRERQNAAISAAHERGLHVCVNAFRPDDVFGRSPVPLNTTGGGNPGGIAPVLATGDSVLLESFGGDPERLEPFDRIRARIESAVEGRRRYGARVLAVASAASSSDPTSRAYLWWLASVFGLDAFGTSDEHYGAPASRLSWRIPPGPEQQLRAARSVDLQPSASARAWRRLTTAGTITIDPYARTGSLSQGK